MGHRNRGKTTLGRAPLALCVWIWLLAAGTSVQADCLDVDRNGQHEALTDGILTIRHLFGLTGTALTSGALGTGATRTNPQDIEQFLTRCNQTVCGDGIVSFDEECDYNDPDFDHCSSNCTFLSF